MLRKIYGHAALQARDTRKIKCHRHLFLSSSADGTMQVAETVAFLYISGVFYALLVTIRLVIPAVPFRLRLGGGNNKDTESCAFTRE
ncbi:hypothetical protein BaRGS_00030164 [Batillaria attramentaria]|uniref:Uncharacterized protein n=1 Tax=Batillaria attramentaria TaxID=370345 RepID=A0ABD0JU01_9CAEN